MLETCYNTFYHPSNMMLFVVGNINADTAINVIRENQAKKNFETAQPIICQKNIEPCKVKTKEYFINGC